MEIAGTHQNVERLDQRDINGLAMVTCRDCGTFAHAHDHDAAVKDLGRTECSANCVNCNNLRRSGSHRPAVPIRGDCNTLLHVCPNDGNRWWQTNGHFHQWKQVTNDREWESLRNPRPGQYDIDHFD